jgi:ribosomal protein L14
MAAVQSFFDASIQESAFMSVVGTHSLDGNVIDVTTNILPYANFDNATVYIVVFEYKTVENVASNGETEFHHVMMKMLPDANGTTTAFEDRAPITINESFDMSSTNVEEIDDLGVAVIVQAADGYVYQAIYSMEDEVYATEARLDDAQMDGTSVEGFDSDTFEYDINLPSNTTDVPEITGIPMDENAIVVVEPTMELPGTTIVDVFGQDLLSHNRYEFNFTLGVGVNNLAAKQVKVYPNPVSDILYIKNLPENSSVRVADMSGRTIAVYNANELSSELQINTSEYENGVYTLFLTIDNQKVVKKFTVTK